jgi:hypothetical protein
MREFVPLVASRITPPVIRPYRQHSTLKKIKPVLTEAKPQTPGLQEQRAHHDKRSDGLVHPSVPFQQVPDDNAAAEQRDEDVDRNDGVVVRDPEAAGFENSSQIQPHVATSADPQLQATCQQQQQQQLGGQRLAMPGWILCFSSVIIRKTLIRARKELNYCLKQCTFSQL